MVVYSAADIDNEHARLGWVRFFLLFFWGS